MDNDKEEEIVNEQVFDLSNLTPIDHVFEHIVGNQLICTLHNSQNCPSITVKPTEVLEFDEDGRLQLVDKAPH